MVSSMKTSTIPPHYHHAKTQASQRASIPAFVFFSLILMSTNLFAGEAIVATHENGRTVFVNNDAPAPDALSNTPPVHKRLVYWSNVQHRWKRVPMTSAAARSARSAAQEVDAALAAPSTSTSVPQS